MLLNWKCSMVGKFAFNSQQPLQSFHYQKCHRPGKFPFKTYPHSVAVVHSMSSIKVKSQVRLTVTGGSDGRPLNFSIWRLTIFLFQSDGLLGYLTLQISRCSSNTRTHKIQGSYKQFMHQCFFSPREIGAANIPENLFCCCYCFSRGCCFLFGRYLFPHNAAHPRQ